MRAQTILRMTFALAAASTVASCGHPEFAGSAAALSPAGAALLVAGIGLTLVTAGRRRTPVRVRARP